MTEILVLNNRDSFVHNLMQLLRSNSSCRAELVEADLIPWHNLHKYHGILLSPGPGIPTETPGLMKLIDRCAQTHSILGVCLGHQALAEYFGAKLSVIGKPLHGHSSKLKLMEPKQQLWSGIEQDTQVGRYHSWQVDAASIPSCLSISAISREDNCIMAIRHKELDLYGLQFHPESIISQSGATYINNWLSITEQHKNNKRALKSPLSSINSK